jgi:hypothetical protein
MIQLETGADSRIFMRLSDNKTTDDPEVFTNFVIHFDSLIVKDDEKRFKIYYRGVLLTTIAKYLMAFS